MISARDLLFVFVGGAIGGSVRMGLSHLVPTAPGAFPGTTLVINVVGAAALAALTRRWLARGQVASDVQLLVGTGLIGSFTTYSTIAVEFEALLSRGHAGIAVVYVLVTLVGGLLAAGLGWRAARRPAPHRVAGR